MNFLLSFFPEHLLPIVTLDKSTKLVKLQFFILKMGMILIPGFQDLEGN